MTQIEKHSADPRKAMILSNEGQTMEMRTKVMFVRIRIAMRTRPLLKLDMPMASTGSAMVRGSTPIINSKVAIIGRALDVPLAYVFQIGIVSSLLERGLC